MYLSSGMAQATGLNHTPRKLLYTYSLDQVYPSKLSILMCCECYMSLRMTKYRQGKENISTFAVKANSTIPFPL